MITRLKVYPHSIPHERCYRVVLCPAPRICPHVSLNLQVNNTKDKLSAGALAGIVVGSVTGAFIIAAIIFVIVRKRSLRDKVAPALA